MKIDVDKIKTPNDLLAAFQQFGLTHITALNGLMDKVPDALKTEYTKMRDDMNAILAKLKPLDQVPAATDIGYALNSFAYRISDLFEYIDTMRTRFGAAIDDLQKKAVAFHSLEAKQASGELVDKATAQAATDTAVETAKKPLLAEIVTLRKNAIALCGLPEPGEAILGAPVEAFNTALEQAKKNLAVCQSKGFSLKRADVANSGKGEAFIRKSVWLDATAFQGEAQLVDDLAESLKVKVPAAADPMVGGGGAGAAGAATKTKLTLA